MLFLSLLFLAVLPLSSAQAVSRAVLGTVSSPPPGGVEGGQFKSAKGIGANRTGSGGVAPGDIYVVDSNNNRVQQLSTNGSFVRAFGLDVGGAGVDVCTVAASCAAGTAGSGAGALSGPGGIAVDQGTGTVYVADKLNRRIAVYTATGVFQGAFGWEVAGAGDLGDTGLAKLEYCRSACLAAPAAAGAGALGLSAPAEIGALAVNPSNGNLVVGDGTNRRLSEFSFQTDIDLNVTEVQFVRTIGWDVIPGNEGVALETCTEVTGCQQGKTGNGAGQFISNGTASPAAVAVDGNGYVYAVNMKTSLSCSAAEPCGILKFNPDGSFKENWGPTTGSCQVRFTSGTANTVAVINLAVNPATNGVVVVKKTAAGTMRIFEFDEHGSAASCSLSPPSQSVSSETTAPNRGFAVGLDDKLYVHNSPDNAAQISILGPVPPSEPEILLATLVTAASAQLNGKVTIPAPGGDGFDTTYYFEYAESVPEGEEPGWQQAPLVPGALGSTAGPHDVSVVVTKLRPGTDYIARLVSITGSPAVSSRTHFKTQPTAPVVEGAFAEEVTSGGAVLGAHVSPAGLKTNYQFEWTDDETFDKTGQYDKVVPKAARQLGAGSETLVASESIASLKPASRYHFRVRLNNAAGETVGEDVEFETLNACGFTSGRCLELVSPPDKGPVGAGGDAAVIRQQLQFQVAPERTALVYPIAYGLPDATAGAEVLYEGARDPRDLWTTSQISLPAKVVPSSPGTSLTSIGLGFSEDLGCGVLSSTQPLTADTPSSILDKGKSVLYRRKADGTVTALTNRPATNTPDIESLREYKVIGISEDCDRIVFATEFDFEGIPGVGVSQIGRLYEWHQGRMSNAGTIPTGIGYVPAAVNPGSGLNANRWNAVSPDGSRVFYTATSQSGGDIGQLAVFMREKVYAQGDLSAGSATVANVAAQSGSLSVGQEVSGAGIPAGATIVALDGLVKTITLSAPAGASGAGVQLEAFRVLDVSQSQNPSNQNNGSSRYEMAAKNGDSVLFTARPGLEQTAQSGSGTCVATFNGTPNGAGCSLYRHDLANGSLTDVSKPQPLTANPGGAGVVGVLGASADGSSVYFAARGQLVAHAGRTEAENLADDAYSVYLNKNGDLRYVGAIGEQGAARALVGSSATTQRPWSSRVTPSGSHLLFESSETLTGHEPGGGKSEAFVYDADSDDLRCVSCRRDLQPSTAPVGWRFLSDGPLVANVLNPPRTLTDDGQRVFFVSPDYLATGATVGRSNLYEWNEGQVSFISSSEDSTTLRDLEFVGASRNGEDVYFTTVDRLTWQDDDGKLDVYDARMNGGIAEPPPAAAPCDPLQEGSCGSGTGGSGDQAGAPMSAVVQGSGNVGQAGKRPIKKKKSKSKAGKKRKGKKGGGARRVSDSSGSASPTSGKEEGK